MSSKLRDNESSGTLLHVSPATDRETLASYALHAEICKVLTDPKRLMIIDVLRGGEKCVGELAEAVGMRLANASQHLSVLRRTGLIEARREATTIYYRLNEPRIVEACDVIHEIVSQRLGHDARLIAVVPPTPSPRRPAVPRPAPRRSP